MCVCVQRLLATMVRPLKFGATVNYLADNNYIGMALGRLCTQRVHENVVAWHRLCYE